uniref:Uncharacterized protein n=1 Tax=Panagrolaimus sp. PS1159 TaxID=55785 RepID=A0AC35GVY2_9BILA
MKEIENRVQTSVVKKFVIMDDKIDKVIELIDKLEQTTCTELNEIKSLLYQVRNETRASQQTQTMLVASESDEERAEPRIAKSFDLETNLSLDTSRISLNPTILAAELSQPTKAMPNPPTKHGLPSSSASDGETKGVEKSKPSKTMLQKPHRTLDALSVASQSLDQSNESRLDKSSASKPSLLPLTSSETPLSSSMLATEQSQPTKTMLYPSTAHVQASSSTSDTEPKHAAPQKINFSDSKTDVPHEISEKLSSPFALAAEISKSTKTVLKPPIEHEHLSTSVASHGSQSIDAPQFTKRSSGIKPSLLYALKRLHASKATSKPSEPTKTMPQAAAGTAAPVKSIAVTSIKENRHQILNERINESSESSLTVSEHENTNGAPQQKSQEVVADFSICHPEFLDLSESNTSTFIKSSEIAGTQEKLIHDIQNETANEYILPSNPIKKDEYDSVLSSSKPEPYNDLFDFSTLKISATSTPVRKLRPVPLPRSGSKNSSITNINVP